MRMFEYMVEVLKIKEAEAFIRLVLIPWLI